MAIKCYVAGRGFSVLQNIILIIVATMIKNSSLVSCLSTNLDIFDCTSLVWGSGLLKHRGCHFSVGTIPWLRHLQELQLNS